MKLKKGIMFLACLLLAIYAISSFGKVQAATGSLTLNLSLLRNSGYGYKIGDPTNGKNVWKIYDTTKTYKDDTIYCLKGGYGFGSTPTVFDGPFETEYTQQFNMKDTNSITAQYKSALPDVSSKNYMAIMWILDNCYVAPKHGASSDEINKANINKQNLLDAAEEYASKTGNPDISGYEFELLTDDDIDAVQQLAIWHYTNEGDEYSVNTFEFYINAISGTNANYKALSVGGDDGWDRAEACQALFNYFVGTTSKADFTYDFSKTTQEGNPVKLSDTNIKIQETNNSFILGPYKIEELRDIEYSLNINLKDGNDSNIEEYTFLNASKEQFTKVPTAKELVGQEFYISVPKTINVSKIKFSISGSYNITTTTYWSVANPNVAKDQPVVVVKKENKTFEDSREVTKQYFDLALRKFITAINGVAPATSREPQVNVSTLINGTYNRNGENEYTATYTHSKDALPVNIGDKVVYTIRVYNEGEIDGYATEVTDYLPQGLSLASDSTINAQYGWTVVEGTNGKTIKTDYLQDRKIDAFDGENLDNEDLQIECTVIATASEQEQRLKNIAEITAHRIYGNDEIIDRDSEPNNVNTNNYGETSQQDDDDFEDLVLLGKHFDLALRKFITKINGVATSESREPSISSQELARLSSSAITTANKVHPKNALTVERYDIVEYTIRIYNEGNIAGYAIEVTDYLPDGLKLAEESQINTQYGWTAVEGTNGKRIKTNYLQNTKLNAFEYNETDETNNYGLDYADLKIECEVIAPISNQNQNLKNIAEITAHRVEGEAQIIDRDSQPNNVDISNYGTTSQQDDDDFEDLVILGKYFDLSLRKFIVSIKNSEETKQYHRVPQVDVSVLNNTTTTAIYNHDKTPINVSNGNEVIYTIRVYNEGQVDGYVTEITDHLPEQLEFIVDDELNAKYGWTIVDGTNGRKVKTNITSPNTENFATRDTIYQDRSETDDKVLLKAFDGENLDYIDLQIKCRVKDNITLFEKITNIAEITGFTDFEGNSILDRDSQVTGDGKAQIPQDSDLPSYKDTEIERGDEYIPGQQDDDDFEKLLVQRFDLALRKFITGVNDKEITDRAPVFSITDDNKYIYTHTKEPVDVATDNIVIYTLRIFNEGNVAGYATEVKDDMPEGLEFLPDNAINTAFRWKMYKEDGTETLDVNEAKYIKTDFLSKENETDEQKNLIEKFDQETMTMPDYKDIKVAFKVIEPNTSDRIIINTAEIADDSDKNGKSVDDIDSEPNNNVEGEDDIDIEKIKVKYFDLSLRKWVTESIVTYNGKTKVTKTGHKAEDDPEAPAKVEIRANRITETDVKFKFSIRVTNEGEIAGYAKELIDYIPEGLKFEAKDNPAWREEDGKVLTNQLKDTLLQPGESAEVEIVLSWINGKNNMGLKTNWAEIYEDYNDYDSPDIDSDPGNNVKGEDDIDEAPVILAVETGSAPTYIVLAITSISIFAAGVVLIKKFVI